MGASLLVFLNFFLYPSFVFVICIPSFGETVLTKLDIHERSIIFPVKKVLEGDFPHAVFIIWNLLSAVEVRYKVSKLVKTFLIIIFVIGCKHSLVIGDFRCSSLLCHLISIKFKL